MSTSVQVFDINMRRFLSRAAENRRRPAARCRLPQPVPSTSAIAQSQGTYNFEA